MSRHSSPLTKDLDGFPGRGVAPKRVKNASCNEVYWFDGAPSHWNLGVTEKFVSAGGVIGYTCLGARGNTIRIASPRGAITPQNTSTAATILNSWKEIAQFLGRGVRTVQRWEHELHLPIHRIGGGKRSPVFANVRELRFWLNTSAARQEYSHNPPLMVAPTLVVQQGGKPIENSRRLLQAARTLATQIAETSVRQRRQAEDLQTRILQMRARIK